MQKISIAEFEEKHVDQAARVLTRSFIFLNTAWKHYQLPYEEVFRVMRGKVLPALKSRWSFVLLENNVVIGICIQYEMLEYINMPNMPNNLQFFKKLGKVGAELESSVNLDQIRMGDSIYGLYGVIDPDHANKGYSLRFWWECFSIGIAAGWKNYYSRISNPVSLKMLQKLGAEVVGEAELVDGALREKFWMIKIDFTKPFPSYSMLKAMTQKAKHPTAKF